MLDPPPPKPPKGSQVDDTSTGFHDPEQAAAAGALPVYCDRSYPVPDGQDVWARYDPNAQRLRTTLESGPARHAVRRRVTLDYDTWEELEDMADPRQAGTERLCACVPAGKHRTRNIATLLFYELPSTGGTGCGGCIMPCRPCSETRNIRKPATAAQDDGGLGYWARVDVDQSHHQLPHDGGPAWESVVRGGGTLDARAWKVISDDYRPQNGCLGRPTPLRRRQGKLYDLVAIFYYYADGEQRDWKTVMKHTAIPTGMSPRCY